MSEPTQERWLPVVGYEGLYEVSSIGRVKSLPRVKRNRYKTTPGRILTLKPYLDAYRQVCLYLPVPVGYDRKYRSVHSLVAESFIGPRPEGLQVRHLDGNGSNNRVGNLAYGTQSENEQDKAAYGKVHHYSARTHCGYGHPFDDENTYRRDGDGSRRCRTCARKRNLETKRRARERGANSV